MSLHFDYSQAGSYQEKPELDHLRLQPLPVRQQYPIQKLALVLDIDLPYLLQRDKILMNSPSRQSLHQINPS